MGKYVALKVPQMSLQISLVSLDPKPEGSSKFLDSESFFTIHVSVNNVKICLETTDMYGSDYGPPECCNNVYMGKLFYVDMSRYNTSGRHEIHKHDHLNHCD